MRFFAFLVNTAESVKGKSHMKRVSKYLFLAMSLTTAASLIAGEAVMIGSASLQANPDCVTLNINVDATCYASPSEASKAADHAASGIYTFLKQTLDANRDLIATDGGFTQSYERYVDGKTECSGTYRKSSTIQISVRSVPEFVNYFDQIQNKVFDEFNIQGNGSENTSKVSITIGSPTPDLFESSRHAMMLKARGLAIENALEKFKASVPAACKMDSYRVTKISDPESSSSGFYAGKAAAAPMAPPSGESAPVSFKPQVISESVMLTIHFNGGDCEPGCI